MIRAPEHRVEGTRLVAHDLTKRFRRGSETIVAVDRVSFELAPGTLTVLAGPSGSGKTTLLNLILGWEVPDAGTIEGTAAGSGDAPSWSSLAVVPQNLGLLDEITVRENITLPRRFGARAGALADADIDETMERLDLGAIAGRRPSETSLGEQQRTSIVRAVCARPLLLVADEPTSHQDEASTARVVGELVAAAEAGTTVIVATHDPRVMARSSRILHLDDGRLRDRG